MIGITFKEESKSEALKGGYRGYWSRNINKEYRLVYAVSGTKGRDQKYTIQCRFISKS
ncbi:type II toxin-antitoxin system YoeB family toxin [Cyclobacterium xiamenense]|uniref:type II toxin-antitoxin system YoeB family toxin n=1 Tax=Cyclobacterium xiamenense TaxID=1297121 RepID=UPI0035CF1B8A